MYILVLNDGSILFLNDDSIRQALIYSTGTVLVSILISVIFGGIFQN